MSNQKELDKAIAWLNYHKEQLNLFPDAPQHFAGVRRYEKQIELLELGCKVQYHCHGWLVNDRYIILVNYNKWRVNGKATWYWYKDLATLVTRFKPSMDDVDNNVPTGDLCDPRPATPPTNHKETDLNNITMEVITHAQAALELRSKKQKARDEYKQKLYQTLKSLSLEGVVKIPRNSYPYKTEPGAILNTINMFGPEKFIYRSNEWAFYIQRVK